MLLKLRGMCAVLLAALAFAGCSDDDAASSLATNFDELEFSYEESDQQLLIRSTVPWTLDCTYLTGDGWLAFDKTSGPGDEGIVSQRVTIKALHNTGVERTAELHITGAGFDRKVTVVQEDGQVRIDGVELEGDMAKDEPVEKTYIAVNYSRAVGGEKLTVTDGTNKAFAYGDAEPQPARTDPTESLSRSLSKTGGTPFSAEKIDVEMDGGPWFVPGSAINELRREALDALLKKRETLSPWPVNEVELPPLPLRTLPPHRTLRARFERWEQVPEQALSGVEYLILPIAQADRVPREWREKTLLELPRVMFGALEEDTARRIAATQDAGFAGYEVSNIAHLRLCRGLPMTGGFGLNVTNNLAAQYYADLGLRSVLILPEVKDSDISTIAPTRDGKPVPTGVITYGHMPLMVTRACPLQNIHDCAHCDKTGLLTDRKAKKFPVRCGLGVRTIYNPVPIYMGDKPGALTVDYGVAYFTLESREEAAAILDSIRQHAPFEGEFTRGLYFKGTN